MKKVGFFIFYVSFGILNGFCSEILVKPKALPFVPLELFCIERSFGRCPICKSELESFKFHSNLYCPQCSSTLENMLERMFLNEFYNRMSNRGNPIVELIIPARKNADRTSFLKRRWKELNNFLFNGYKYPMMTCLFSPLSKYLNAKDQESRIEVLTIFENSLVHALKKLIPLGKRELELFFARMNNDIQSKVLTQRSVP